MQQHLAPGMRVVIRDTEWIIRKAVLASDGGQQITCDGVSELVKGREGIFLTTLENNIQILDPAKTQLVLDSSSNYADSLLFIESQLRRQAINDERIHVAHQGAMDLVPYQLDPTIQALEQPRQRILIADAVGLGKTLEAGILVSELIHRGRGKRILVLTLKSMMTQFQKELWNRFTIPLTRLDSIGLQRVRNRIPTNHNPFYYYDKSIISIDTLKQDSEYRVYLEQAYWDIIIIDECHNVADRNTSSQRARLAKLLATRSDTLIMLSATPHDGRARSFASLMNMLDPTAISDPENYTKNDFSNKGLVVRRFKKDIQEQVDHAFKDRHVFCRRHKASHEEEAAYDALLDIKFTRKGETISGKGGALLRVTFQKALFSSPAACQKSISERINKLGDEQVTEQTLEEIDALERLDNHLLTISPEKYEKYQNLLSLIVDSDFNWNPKQENDRLVIFSERIETLNFLHKQLRNDLKLKQDQITIMHGGMSDQEQQQIVEDFGNRRSKLRILLCSDVASEGINLHYQSHRLIHFDLPWSLMVFQQRNGRVDRYGQNEEPEIYYLITESQNPTIRGDMRILEVLEEKDQQAYNDIGDPSVFMGVCDSDVEEKITKEAIASGQEAEKFNQDHQPDTNLNEGDELLALFLGTGETQEEEVNKIESSTAFIVEPLSLFPNHYQWCKHALSQLEKRGEKLQYKTNDATHRITLTATDDLNYRFKFLPREVGANEGQFVLTDQKNTIIEEIERSREDENAWPKVHYLWPQHPIVEWLSDRMMTAFGRHTAPVVKLYRGIPKDECIFIFSGLIPNQKGHPVVNEWMGVIFQKDTYQKIVSFSQVLEQTKLATTTIPNRNNVENIEFLQNLLPESVQQAQAYMKEKRDAFEKQINIKLDHQLNELDKLKEGQLKQLDLFISNSKMTEGRKAHQRANKEQTIHDVFDAYLKWIEETMTTEPYPYVQLIAVLQGDE